MGKTVTSAGANKMLRELEDEKQYLLSMEESSSTYIETEGVEPVIPEYDYMEAERSIEAIDEKVVRIKHAINVFNCTTTIPGSDMTIDQALVRMAQLNRRKNVLDSMRKKNPKSRVRNQFNPSKFVEYTCLNYDLDDVKEQYEIASAKIIELQMKIDRCNQTLEFEIED